MKKCLSLFLALILLLSLAGCNQEPKVLKGNFDFTLPEGYSIENVTARDCSFLRQVDGAKVGGAEVTEISKRHLNNKGITEIMKYLQEEFHKTNNVEFFSFSGEGKTPYVSITLQRPDETERYKRHFQHLLFLKEDAVYHVWFDTDVIDEEIREEIVSSLV